MTPPTSPHHRVHSAAEQPFSSLTHWYQSTTSIYNEVIQRCWGGVIRGPTLSRASGFRCLGEAYTVATLSGSDNVCSLPREVLLSGRLFFSSLVGLADAVSIFDAVVPPAEGEEDSRNDHVIEGGPRLRALPTPPPLVLRHPCPRPHHPSVRIFPGLGQF